jgi:hypothetical protein
MITLTDYESLTPPDILRMRESHYARKARRVSRRERRYDDARRIRGMA